MEETLNKLKQAYKSLPEHKTFLEVVGAFLTIPVLLTVIISNVNNLNNMSKNKNPDSTEKHALVPTQTVIQSKTYNNETKSPQTIPTEFITPSPKVTQNNNLCKKEVGPIEITYPEEQQVVSTDPLTITISRKSDEYCAVVWSYRINNGSWSDYTDKSLYLYNLSNGEKKLDLKVKSIVSGDEVVISRDFTYQNPNISPTPTVLTPTPTATSSALPN